MLTVSDIQDFCILKEQYWKYGLKKQLGWWIILSSPNDRIIFLEFNGKKISLYDVKTVSRRTQPYKRSKLGSIIYRPLKAVQKKLGVRIVLVDETTGQVIIPEKKENVEQKKANRR